MRSGCDPHRPRGPVLGMTPHSSPPGVGLRSSPTTGGRCWTAAPSATCSVSPQLRSSPTTGGRCWHEHRAHIGAGRNVAILTDHGGPALGRRAAGNLHRQLVAILTDHGGPVLAQGRAGLVFPTEDVAILTDHGGPVLVLPPLLRPGPPPRRCDPHRPRGAGAGPSGLGNLGAQRALRSSPTTGGRCWARYLPTPPNWTPVAILTDHGGPVLGCRWICSSARRALRSSPTTGGRCWLARETEACGSPWLRSSPTTGGRCWALPAIWFWACSQVAILTDHGGPVLAGVLRMAGRPPRVEGCDPHRPRGAGAGWWRGRYGRGTSRLRSSPTTGGRCWMGQRTPTARSRCGCDPHRPRGAGAGWRLMPTSWPMTSLRSSPTTGGRCWAGLNGHRLPHFSLRSSPTTGGRCWGHLAERGRSIMPQLRSSPTTGGRCWRAPPRPKPRRGWGCDPHRPRGAGAGRYSQAMPTNSQSCDPHRPRGAGAGWPRASADPWQCVAVAILTDHGGPVLGALRGGFHRPHPPVAILTDHGGPVLGRAIELVESGQSRCDPHRPRGAGAGSFTATGATPASSCDPHRPRGAGAGGSDRVPRGENAARLRSSPTTGGRCWSL